MRRKSGILVVMLLLCSFDTSLGTLEPVDYLALQAVRKSLYDLPGSTFFAGWDFTGDPCGFPGVFCSAGRVVALALGDPRAGSPGLAGRLSPALGRLSALAELSLVPGRVVGPIPPSLSLCRSLRFLALSRNFLSGAVPTSLPSLRGLRTLDLSFNLLSGPIPPAIAGIPALSNLILCHNRLSGQIPPFPSSSPLLRLDLKRNSLSGAIPALPASLRYLSLASNGLSGPVDRVLPRLTRLNYLDLSMNQLSGQIPGQIFSFPVSSLQLQRNDFSGPVRPVGSLADGATVDLSYNQLTGPVPGKLAAAGRLYLDNNRFSGKVPARFVERVVSGAIKVLYLQHNYLTGFGISPAATIPASTSLCLQYNCMVPPVETPCPVKAGRQKTRPAAQCGWRKG
ncbi:leucine-rich repeat receptor-like kinase protein FLORAL ORGAN NUMBER1 [Phoenix dactylifera]|uniref:Leucine-rich repeat receptor-like kinase protein FLORAL ORGAN NUMBER1 n=1 Tax=Phoenix dactylifera TaxID=42345 RepID=A0A8B7CV80_PHODC|nr:leucine-rich repeat receptor-like kinase protein FLORAL ORGAN NUMBER1 [Phoenix dactylifera]